MFPDRDILNTNKEELAYREVVIKDTGQLLAEYLLSQENPKLLLDMDGVIFEADSLHQPTITTFDIIPTMQELESLGIALGPATGRSWHVVGFLREQGLKLTGSTILEEGQVIVENGNVQYLEQPGHRAFIHDMKEQLEKHPHFAETWEDARKKAEHTGFAFSPGNYQWQGECRASLWFPYMGDPTQDKLIVARMIEPTLQQLAPDYGLDYTRDLSIGVNRMVPNEKNGNLAIVGIKGKKDGKPINKGLAAEKLDGTWAFVADGFGDVPLSYITRSRNGIVIGIEGNLDIAEDAAEFLNTAHAVLKTPNEFSQALRHTATILKGKQISSEQ